MTDSLQGDRDGHDDESTLDEQETLGSGINKERLSDATTEAAAQDTKTNTAFNRKTYWNIAFHLQSRSPFLICRPGFTSIAAKSAIVNPRQKEWEPSK
ncbi:MAG: hypothetical protein V3U88_01260 [Methylococcales bacterium]